MQWVQLLGPCQNQMHMIILLVLEIICMKIVRGRQFHVQEKQHALRQTSDRSCQQPKDDN